MRAAAMGLWVLTAESRSHRYAKWADEDAPPDAVEPAQPPTDREAARRGERIAAAIRRPDAIRLRPASVLRFLRFHT